MKINAQLMHTTSAPPLNRSRIIIGDGSNKKVEFIGIIYPIFTVKLKFQQPSMM